MKSHLTFLKPEYNPQWMRKWFYDDPSEINEQDVELIAQTYLKFIQNLNSAIHNRNVTFSHIEVAYIYEISFDRSV